jgi:putative glutamine amidotransferase
MSLRRVPTVESAGGHADHPVSEHRSGTRTVPGGLKEMSGKPLIGITMDYRASRKEHAALSFVAAGYYDGVMASGGIPIALPPNAEEDDLVRLLDMLDGVVLVGGGDIDPRRDGYMPHPATRPMDSRREDFDRMLVSEICRRQMPVLGVGSGMQLLNIAEGGTLFLHIPEDLPKAMPHKDPLDVTHRHALEVVPGTVMERVYGDGEIRVNSMHHMAIDDLASSFRVAARAPDGVIEAIESTVENWVAIGTQFHPEAENASALDAKIFEEFVIGITGEVPAVKLVA